MATFSESKDILSQWKGKPVHVEMISGAAPQSAWEVFGELEQVYDDAILLKVSHYAPITGEDVEVLFFAQAIRANHVHPPKTGA